MHLTTNLFGFVVIYLVLIKPEWTQTQCMFITDFPVLIFIAFYCESSSRGINHIEPHCNHRLLAPGLTGSFQQFVTSRSFQPLSATPWVGQYGSIWWLLTVANRAISKVARELTTARINLSTLGEFTRSRPTPSSRGWSTQLVLLRVIFAWWLYHLIRSIKSQQFLI